MIVIILANEVRRKFIINITQNEWSRSLGNS